MMGYRSQRAEGKTMTVSVITGNISAFRLASLRGMLRLEKAGLKTRGGALRPRIAAELGLSPRASHDVFIEEISRRLQELEES